MLCNYPHLRHGYETVDWRGRGSNGALVFSIHCTHFAVIEGDQVLPYKACSKWKYRDQLTKWMAMAMHSDSSTQHYRCGFESLLRVALMHIKTSGQRQMS